MALTNTVLHGLAVPFLLLFTLPMMAFAMFTGGIAFAVLGARFAFGLVQLTIALIKYWVFRPRPTEIPESTRRNFSNVHEGWKTPVTPPDPVSSASWSSTRAMPPMTIWNPGFASPYRRRSSLFAESTRRASQLGSQSSLDSGGAITPILEDHVFIDGDAIMSPSLGMARDYEGLGGWREDDGDESWLNINSRLELPSHTQRSHSLGPLAPNNGAWYAMAKTHPTEKEKRDMQMKKAPLVQANSSRVRVKKSSRSSTSVTVPPDRGGYFDEMVSPKTVRRSTHGSGL